MSTPVARGNPRRSDRRSRARFSRVAASLRHVHAHHVGTVVPASDMGYSPSWTNRYGAFMDDLSAKLTPLGVMVLALLREGDMHPYEMMRLMRHRRDDRLVPIQNGTFYHTVGRLERAGLLAEVGVDRDGNRPERTTYTLTDSGRERRAGMGAPRAAAHRPAGRVPRRARGGAQPPARRGRRPARHPPRRAGRQRSRCTPAAWRMPICAVCRSSTSSSSIAKRRSSRPNLPGSTDCAPDSPTSMPWGIADIPEETLHRLIALREAQRS